MNERIKELAELASKDNSDGYPVTLEYSNKFAERFAELIVRECVETLRLVPYYTEREFGDEVIYQDVVKNHFGVE